MTDKKQEPVSVIINVYNEVQTIEHEVRTIYERIIKKLPGSECIIAEDGSTDGTKEILQRLVRELGVIHSTAIERKGYTRALRDALAKARNPYIFFSDTGGKNNFDDFWKLYLYRQEHGLVIGKRSGRQDQIYRQVLTWGYNFILRHYFGVPITDADSGFRLYKRELVQELLRDNWVFKDLIGSELVVRAVYSGYQVKEVPISYRQRGTVSRGLPPNKIPKVIWRTLLSFPVLKKHLKIIYAG